MVYDDRDRPLNKREREELHRKYMENEADRRRHNESTLDKLRRGDRVKYERGMYSHWAIYVGNGKIVHLTQDGIEEISFWKAIVDGGLAHKDNSNDSKWNPLDPDVIVSRAKGKIGKKHLYNVRTYNCEHFANWCRYDRKVSEQINIITVVPATVGGGFSGSSNSSNSSCIIS